MAQPINYMAMLPQVDISRSLLGGLQAGSAIREIQQQQVAAQQAELAKQQYADDLNAAFSDGTQGAFLRLIAKYPKQREAFDTVRKGIGEERVKNEFNQGFEISAALENNNPEVAKQRLSTIIDRKSVV